MTNQEIIELVNKTKDALLIQFEDGDVWIDIGSGCFDDLGFLDHLSAYLIDNFYTFIDEHLRLKTLLEKTKSEPITIFVLFKDVGYVVEPGYDTWEGYEVGYDYLDFGEYQILDCEDE